VHKAFKDKGLDAFEYGLLCYDEWEDEFEVREVEVLNDDGSPRTRTKKIKEKHRIGGREMTVKGTVEVPVTKKMKVKVREAGSRWGVRYEEALAMEAALMRRAVNRLSKSS
jgi:hypothetical protein